MLPLNEKAEKEDDKRQEKRSFQEAQVKCKFNGIQVHVQRTELSTEINNM